MDMLHGSGGRGGAGRGGGGEEADRGRGRRKPHPCKYNNTWRAEGESSGHIGDDFKTAKGSRGAAAGPSDEIPYADIFITLYIHNVIDSLRAPRPRAPAMPPTPRRRRRRRRGRPLPPQRRGGRRPGGGPWRRDGRPPPNAARRETVPPVLGWVTLGSVRGLVRKRGECV